MSYYVIIRGPLGCGKTTVAKKLGEALGAEYISIDDIIERRNLYKDKENGFISQKSFIRANTLVIAKAKGLLDKGKPVIFDHNFYWKSHIDDLIARLHYPHFDFTLKAPLATCIERDGKREKTCGRDAVEAVYRKSTEFDFGTVVDATRGPDKIVNKILFKILLSRIRINFPELKWTSAQKKSNGCDHAVFILDHKIVFRFPINDYAREMFTAETGFLRVISKKVKPASVPVYKYLPSDVSFGGYECIHGRSLTVLAYKKLSARAKLELARSIGDFISKLHRVRPSQVAGFSVKERLRMKEWKEMNGRYRKFIASKSGGTDKDKFKSFFKELSRILHAGYAKKVVHNDFSGDNILIDDSGKLCGIIDFTDRALDDPAFDFAQLWAYGQEFVRLVFQYYAGTDTSDILYRSAMYHAGTIVWFITSAAEKNEDYKKLYRRFLKMYDIIKNMR